MFFQSILNEPMENFNFEFDPTQFCLITPMPTIYSSYPSYKPIQIFCLLSSQFQGKTELKISFYNPKTRKTENKFFAIELIGDVENCPDMHTICVKKFLDNWQSGNKQETFTGQDLSIYGD